MNRNIQAMSGFFREKKDMGAASERRITNKPVVKVQRTIRVTKSGEPLKQTILEATQETERLAMISQLVRGQNNYGSRTP